MAQTPPELLAMMQRVQLILEQMIAVGDSGTVTIGYGNKGLRLVVNRHEKSVPITEPEACGTVIRKVR